MELKPYIASYSGQGAAAIRRFFNTTPALELVARAAQGPLERGSVDPALLAELVEMHVLSEQDEQVRLATAVFLEEDIVRVNEAARTFAAGLVERVVPAAAPLAGEPPALLNFQVGILAIGQTLGRALRDERVALDWQHYGGRYAASKVDFEQACPAAEALGPDLQNKNVLRGQRFSAIFIGPGGEDYRVHPGAGAAPERADYLHQLNRYLTDAYAAALAAAPVGGPAHPDLWAAAQAAGLGDERAAGFLSNEMVARHRPFLTEVGRVSRAWFRSSLGSLQDLLASTAGGRQGVPPATMMMHLWRSLRRAVAVSLYTRGFFSDRVPETGVITVFYENDAPLIKELLG